MRDWEPNIQAYRTIAEVLISFRKIMLRGLQRQSGSEWYRNGCPPEVYRRLVDRKETELAIERSSLEYQDLMSFATFGDMAEIVDSNDELARLLKNMAPTRQVLCGRLSELESLRSKLSMARALTAEEQTILTNYHINLREMLSSARRRARGETARPPHVREEADTLVDQVEEEPEPLTAMVDDELEELVEEPEDSLPDLVIDTTELLEESAEVLESGADADLLRLLRREVVAVAEGVHRLAADIRPRVWLELGDSGWYEEHAEELGIEPIEYFYRIVVEYLGRRQAGASAEELRELLAECEFSKLLLTLRELFLSHEL